MSEIVPEQMLEDIAKEMNNKSASEISKSLDAVLMNIEQGKTPSKESIEKAEKVKKSKKNSKFNKEKAKIITKHTTKKKK